MKNAMKYLVKMYITGGANFFIDIAELKKKNINHRKIYEITEKYLKDVDGINSVIIKEDVLKSEKNDDLTIRLKNMIHPMMSPLRYHRWLLRYLYRSPLVHLMDHHMTMTLMFLLSLHDLK